MLRLFTRSVTPITDPAPALTARFIARLREAGLTDDDMAALLADYDLADKAVNDIKTSVIASGFMWGNPTLHYASDTDWTSIASGVELQRTDNKLCIAPNCPFRNHFLARINGEVRTRAPFGLIHLGFAWKKAATGVQVRLVDGDDGVAVRTLIV